MGVPAPWAVWRTVHLQRCTAQLPGTMHNAPCLLGLPQYTFMLKEAACPSCPELKFNSSTVVGVFPGLKSNTTVGSQRGAGLPEGFVRNS